MPIRYEDYLAEAKKKAEEAGVVITFGRMNPPTLGHGALVKKVIDVAKGAEHRIYVSQSQDEKKNPLKYQTKIKFLRKMFPKANIIKDTSIKTPFDVFGKLDKEGYKKVTMVVGDDRLAEFRKGIKRIDVGYKFKAVSAGKRDPDSEGVAGMSASKMRAFARENKFKKFFAGLGGTLSNADAQSLFDSVRKGMKLKLNEVSYVNENDYEVGDIVEYSIDGSFATVLKITPTQLVCEVVASGDAYEKSQIVTGNYNNFSSAYIMESDTTEDLLTLHNNNPAKALAHITEMSISSAKKLIKSLSVDEAFNLFKALSVEDYDSISSILESSEAQLEVGSDKLVKNRLALVPGQKIEIASFQQGEKAISKKTKTTTENFLEKYKGKNNAK
jgi:hypothetical protein